MLERIKKAVKILIGRETEKKEKIFTSFQAIDPLDSTFLEKINVYQYEFIFTEFGEERVNAGGAVLSQQNRLEPSLSGIKKYFPHAKITVYTDFDWQETGGLNIIKVQSPVVDADHPRFGYRTGNYFKFKGLLESKADFACALDSDMFFVNENVYSLVMLTLKFGFCAPYNIRQLLKQDMVQSLDTQPIKDESLGMGRSYNQSPMTLWKNHEAGRKYYTACMEIMKNDPSRGSLVMWKAAWETGVHPYVLPKQFCVCDGDIGCDDEVILHVGHPSVAKYYKL